MNAEFDIKSIEFGYLQLDSYLKDELMFLAMINRSEPLRWCLREVYKTFARLGELPVFWKNLDCELIQQARQIAMKWCVAHTENNIEYFTQIVLVINRLAEKRLEKTSGI